MTKQKIPLVINGNIKNVDDGCKLFILTIFDRNKALDFIKELREQKILDKRKRCHICNQLLPKYKVNYCSPECYKTGHDKAHKKALWRKLRRIFNQPISPSLAYEKKSKFNTVGRTQ